MKMEDFTQEEQRQVFSIGLNGIIQRLWSKRQNARERKLLRAVLSTNDPTELHRLVEAFYEESKSQGELAYGAVSEYLKGV